jgi:hypothetical protein
LVLEVIKARILPIPVAIPANKVNPIANHKFSI